MINKLSSFYIKKNTPQIKPKKRAIVWKENKLKRVMTRMRSSKYSGHWIKSYGRSLESNFKNRITRFHSTKEPAFIKSEQHRLRYNYFLRQFSSPQIYKHINFPLKKLFSLSTRQGLNWTSNYSRFNNKKLNLDFDIFIVSDNIIIGVVKVAFVQSLKSTDSVRYLFNSYDDLTKDSILLVSSSGIVVGFVKQVFRPISLLFRASHPLTEITHMQILDSMKDSSAYSRNSLNNYTKLNFKARLKRARRLKIRARVGYLSMLHPSPDVFQPRKSDKNPRTQEYFLNKFYNLKNHTEFMATQILRFVIHLYWKYMISESNIFSLQAHVRERGLAKQLKKFKTEQFASANRHIKNKYTLAQLQPTLEKIIPNKAVFSRWVWENKSSIVADLLQQFKWVKIYINLFRHFSNPKNPLNANSLNLDNFKKTKQLFFAFQRNNYSNHAYFINIWTQELIRSMRSCITLEDIVSIKEMQKHTNFDVPTYLEYIKRVSSDEYISLSVDELIDRRTSLGSSSNLNTKSDSTGIVIGQSNPANTAPSPSELEPTLKTSETSEALKVRMGVLEKFILFKTDPKISTLDLNLSWLFFNDLPLLDIPNATLSDLRRGIENRFITLYYERSVKNLSKYQNLWILWSMRYFSSLTRTFCSNLYRPHLLREQPILTKKKKMKKNEKTKRKEPALPKKIKKIPGLEGINVYYEEGVLMSPETGLPVGLSATRMSYNTTKPFFRFVRNRKLRNKFNFNVSPQFVPQTSVSLFLKKLFKSKDFDLQQVMSPTFLQTPYIGVDFNDGFDPKFYANPNKYILKYLKQDKIRKVYTIHPNYTYKPKDLSNLRAVSLCFSILHEKVNIDEGYLRDLFSAKPSARLKKQSVQEFKRLTSTKSRRAFKKQLFAQSTRALASKGHESLESSRSLTSVEKLNLNMIYNPKNLKGVIRRKPLSSAFKYKLSLKKFITAEDFGVTAEDVWNELTHIRNLKWDHPELDAPSCDYTSWHNKEWAMNQIWHFTTKISKKLWLNLLGFNELLESGLGNHQLKECTDMMFKDAAVKDSTKTSINSKFMNYLINPVERKDYIDWYKIAHLFVSRHTKKRIFWSVRQWNRKFGIGGYAHFRNFDDLFSSRFLYSNKPWGKSKWRGNILYSHEKVVVANQSFNPIQPLPVNKQLNLRQLQSRTIKLLMNVYSTCTLYNSLARRFLPSYLTNNLRRDSQFLIEQQPNLIIEPKPLTYKLLFRFKKHYLYITLLDQKNDIVFSLHTGLFLRFFDYKKSLKKSKSLKILLVRYLRKLLLLSSIRTFNLYVKQTSDQLNKLLQILQRPINHPFTDPLTGFVVNDERKKRSKKNKNKKKSNRSAIFNFVFIYFFKSKPYGIMKTKKTGRLKRKIRRLVIKINRIID